MRRKRARGPAAGLRLVACTVPVDWRRGVFFCRVGEEGRAEKSFDCVYLDGAGWNGLRVMIEEDEKQISRSSTVQLRQGQGWMILLKRGRGTRNRFFWQKKEEGGIKVG